MLPDNDPTNLAAAFTFLTGTEPLHQTDQPGLDRTTGHRRSGPVFMKAVPNPAPDPL
jgi:hypothetical protein